MGSAVMLNPIGEKPWKHARVDILTPDDETDRILIPNTDEFSEYLFYGKMVCETYDGCELHINTTRMLQSKTLSNTNCFVMTHGWLLPNNYWYGFGDVNQWDVRMTHDLALENYSTTPDTKHDLLLGSTWLNKTMKVGTYFDIYWR